MDDRGKKPLIEDEFEGSGVVFGNLEFSKDGGYRLSRSTNVVPCCIASSSAAGHTLEDTPYAAHQYTQGECSTSVLPGLGPSISKTSSDEITSSFPDKTFPRTLNQTCYPLGNTHGGVWDPNNNPITEGMFLSGYFGAGSSSRQLKMDAVLNFISSNGNTSFMGQTENHPENSGFYPFQHDVAGNNGASIRIPLLRDEDLVANNLQKILQSGDHVVIIQAIFMLRGSYFRLMTNKQTYLLFHKLLDECNKKQLHMVAHEILSEESFIDAAFTNTGSKSIIRLIKKIRKTPYAFTLTMLLSTRFWDLMTHHIAKDLIPQCFLVLTEEPNRVLYEKAMEYSQDLAGHQRGCTTLNNCISVAAGNQGSRLLHCIANQSLSLSQNQFGNYVVQTILSLQNPSATSVILQCLRGRFVTLALLKSGSHVVEKCISYSPIGAAYVYLEIISDRRVTFRLAQHQFGNYVIQTALIEGKKLPSEYIDLYYTLVEYLEHHTEELSRNPYGRGVVEKLRHI